MRKDERIKADIIGPNTRSGRFPAMSAVPARPNQVSVGVPSLLGLYLLPLSSLRAETRNLPYSKELL